MRFDIVRGAFMRILLVGNFALDRQPSMLRYAEMLCAAMRLRGHQVEVIRPRAVFGGLVRQPAVRKWLGYIDKYLLFPLELRRRARGFDLVHVCDHSNSMYLAHVGGRRASITCHDLLAIESARGRYPQQRISLSGRVLQRWILRHLLLARDVVCVSAYTASELAALSSGAAQRVKIIPNALNPGCAPVGAEDIARVREQIGLGRDENYLLHVGAEVWYKNRAGAVRIFRLLQELASGTGPALRLVMAGQQLTRETRKYIEDNLPHGSVIEVVHPSDDLLWALYSGATALLFPSWYEGFGWPVIEAQRCGCPVIVSNRAPMTEVAGTAALYIDPADEPAAARLIAASLNTLSALKEAGLRNAERFAPSLVFAAYEEFFAGVVRKGAAGRDGQDGETPGMKR
jgi:glycosyltransferase involved in cell wall biosynthesis